MKRTNPTVSLSKFACLSLLVLAACSEAPAPVVPPKVVRSILVGVQAEDTSRSYVGEVRARKEVSIAFRLNGKVTERLVDTGASVKSGQILARLDAADSMLQLQQAEAMRQLAESDLKRYRELHSKGFVSIAALESKETAFRTSTAQAGIIQNQTTYSTLKADRGGTISAVLVEAGQMVAAGQAAFRIAPDGEREVAMSLPERDIHALKVGQQAEVVLWAEPGKPPVRGILREIASGADPATRTYAARVSLPDVPTQLPIGLSAVVRFPKQAPAEIVVPLAAIFQQSDKSAVWVIDAAQRLQLRPVSVQRYEDGGAVLSEGLSQGERIVAAGVHKLVAGEQVRLAEQAASPLSPQ